MNIVPSQPLEPESRPLTDCEQLVEIITPAKDSTIPDIQLLHSWALAAMETDQKPLAIKIVTGEEMSALNLQFAGKNKSTNVLSFPAEQLDEAMLSAMSHEDPTHGADPEIPESLGDIAICAEVVSREAQEQQKTLAAHWAHMVVHGVLHLRGFDHVVESEATVMETREVQILDSLGFPDPYLPQLNSSDEAKTQS